MKKKFSHISLKGIPQQTNGYDCGVFMCQYALYLALGKPFDFTQRDMSTIRRRMALEISQGKLMPAFQ